MSFQASKPRARHLLVAAITLAAAACAAPGAGSPAVPTPAGSGAASTFGPPTPGASAPAATSAGTGTAMVDLTFTGTYAFTAKGTAGRCLHGGGGTIFGFEATEADYPGLGQSFSMAEFNGIVDIKWIKDDDNSWGNSPNATITLTPDHHGISVDQDLAPFGPIGGPRPGPEHVAGTITCP